MTSTPPLSPLGLLLRNTPYRRLYSARLVSLMGDWFNLLALVALLREIGGNGAMALGGTLILKSLPPLLATPIAGWVADRFPRKTIMIASDVGRAVVVRNHCRGARPSPGSSGNRSRGRRGLPPWGGRHRAQRRVSAG